MLSLWTEDGSYVWGFTQYMHKNPRLANDEIAQLRDKDLKNLLHQKKLYLVLDLDHTLLNSTTDIKEEERHLNFFKDDLPDALKNTLHEIDSQSMMTKLRHYVHTFLKEASKMFEMYIYTMGDRKYASEMAKLLDPKDEYFYARVIARGDGTKKLYKGLDVVVGHESAILILDDTEEVWKKHKENLILMERYRFFASSCQHSKSLSELKRDESDTDGALATVLRVFKQIHSTFFNLDNEASLVDRDVRQILKAVRKEVLKGCKVVFESQGEDHELWKMAEESGATCSTEFDSSVTHVVSSDGRTEKSRLAVQEKKFLVRSDWIKAAYHLWRKQPEEKYAVTVHLDRRKRGSEFSMGRTEREWKK